MAETTKPRPTRVQPRPELVPVVDIGSPGRRRVVPLRHGSLTLGRGATADLTIGDDGLSRLHAKLVVTSDGAVELFDLDSTNGSFVNGERVSHARLQRHDEIQLGPAVRLALRYVPAGTDPRGALHPLTDRQLEVACLVADGLTSIEIAERLGLTARTVDSHLGRIFRRLAVRGRAELARLVTEAGLTRLGHGPG